MRKISLYLNWVLLALILTGYNCNPPRVNLQLLLTNTSAVALTDKPILVRRAELGKIPGNAVYPLILSAKGDSIPAQLDDLNGDGQWDELFFVVNLAASGSDTFSLRWLAAPVAFTKRSSARFGKRMAASQPVQPAFSEIIYSKDMPATMGFQKYQTDGPSWENDKVGFRHYLDGRNATDVFGKKIAAISPETVGTNSAGAVEDNYHVMQDWGRDIMAVGNSVGIGGVALLKRDSIMRLGIIAGDTLSNIETTNFHIVTEGPVRSMLNFQYHNWRPASGTYNLDETTSIWPGMYAYHNSVQVSGLEGNESILVGIVNLFATRPPELVRVNDQWVALVSHAKNTYNQQWWLGLALLLPAKDYLGFIEAPKTGQLSNSFLAKMKPGKKPLEYYAVACWETSDERFKDPAYFRSYVSGLGEQLSAKVNIKIMQ